MIEREAHTLKGVAANLGLDSLRYASDGLVQAVRRKEYDEIPALFEIIKTAHEKMVEVLSQLDYQRIGLSKKQSIVQAVNARKPLFLYSYKIA